ncbi:MAG: glycosyltransferase family 2 protein, partial [Bacteroidetes bacterium]
MDLSIIIVSYNVKYYLENCLLSVFRATQNISSEIIVVDNNSSDGTGQYLLPKYGNQIKYIQLSENLGFSKANNRGIEISQGRYVVLLNPDTIVAEDTFEKLINHLDQYSEVGAAGVKMIDGKGKFLPESKRGLPTPWVAFYKIFGLSALFPKSTKFGKYHLTYLDKNQLHYVDVLSGAFMFIRANLLKEIGGLDEDYFMYGEDIDLSYQITRKGYKNLYFPHTTIIHYKGESTKKETFK